MFKRTQRSPVQLSRFTWNDERLEFYEFYERSSVEEFHANGSIIKTRKRLPLCKKLEINEYYAIHKSYTETARVFGLQYLIVRKIYKAAPPKKTNKGWFGGLKQSKDFKGNKKGAGKPLSYPLEIDQEVLVLLLEMKDTHIPVCMQGMGQKITLVLSSVLRLDKTTFCKK